MSEGDEFVIEFVIFFFAWELVFLLFGLLLASNTISYKIAHNEFSLAELIFDMVVGAVGWSPISLMLSLMTVAALQGESSHDSGWEEHHYRNEDWPRGTGGAWKIHEEMERNPPGYYRGHWVGYGSEPYYPPSERDKDN
jgi:hypothetical protein